MSATDYTIEPNYGSFILNFHYHIDYCVSEIFSVNFLYFVI